MNHNQKLFTIDSDKLAEITRLYGDMTGDEDTVSEVRDTLINYDWHNDSDHQEWLDTATPQEIASWLQSFAFGDSAN